MLHDSVDEIYPLYQHICNFLQSCMQVLPGGRMKKALIQGQEL